MPQHTPVRLVLLLCMTGGRQVGGYPDNFHQCMPDQYQCHREITPDHLRRRMRVVPSKSKHNLCSGIPPAISVASDPWVGRGLAMVEAGRVPFSQPSRGVDSTSSTSSLPPEYRGQGMPGMPKRREACGFRARRPAVVTRLRRQKIWCVEHIAGSGADERECKDAALKVCKGSRRLSAPEPDLAQRAAGLRRGCTVVAAAAQRCHS
ncbi:hypothetical protein DFH09DRAFT_1125903 [Mycena vulgaris]|nr:hypothetical protein DFH09DRAFT_1125903 [Mycena vulgaris]